MSDSAYVEQKLRSVSALAQSTADDLRSGRFWDGDLEKRIRLLQEELSAAYAAARNMKGV